jgi:uncharacterized coiled-coil protein SlyX
MQIFEISNKKTKNGKRKFKAILYKVHPDSCVVDKTGTEFNLNGITWIEEYCQNNIDSIAGMSVTVEFLDDERVEILGHGDTGVEDGIPIYNNATMIGHFEKGYITDMEVNGEMCRVCVGEGYFDYMRYKPFVDSIETRINNGETIFGSVEIMGMSENDNKIIYLDGWKPEGRIPQNFVHSGWAILSIKPSDDKSTLVEINQNQSKEEIIKMDEKELKAIIESTIKETNSKNDELTNAITELNSTIVEKDNTIAELNASVSQLQTALDGLKKDIDTYWAERNIIEEELAKAKVAQRLGELNSAIEVYSAEEQKYAEVEINAFKEDAIKGDIDAVISKICVGIVAKQKEIEKLAEQNSAKEDNDVEDIFSEVNSADGAKSDEETSIF